MELEEARHYLSVLIELDLFPTLRIYTEGNFSKEKLNQEQQRAIIDFINKLPDDYKKVPNRDEIIAETLEKMGIHTVWGQKKIEEIQMQKRLEEEQNSTQQAKRTDELEK